MMRIALIAASVLTWAAPAAADVFLLRNGGRVEGQLLNPDQSPRHTYVVKTDAGAVVTLAASQVQDVVRESEALAWYERWLPKMPRTAEGNWIMARECQKRGLRKQREHHLREVLKYDPDHAAARAALGYLKIDGKWVLADDWMRRQGYVNVGGSWRLPQELQLEQEKEEREEQQRKWRRDILMWRGWILQNRGRRAEGLERIQAVDDPLAAPALIDLLNRSDEPEQLKLIYVDVLGRLRTPDVVTAFVQHAVTDPSDNVRDACLEQLADWGAAQAAALLTPLLQHKDNRVVNRAAAALGRLKRPETILPLIEALTTKHRRQVSRGGGGGGLGIDAGFSPSGGGGLNLGGGPKIMEFEVRNPQVKAALHELLPNVDFGYDKQAWRRWYARQQAPSLVDLRRSP